MNRIAIVPCIAILATVALFAVLSVPVRSTPLQSSDIAIKAYDVLEKHCGKCHGREKTGGFTFLNYKSMVENGHILPGKPAESRIFIRIAKSPGDPMPPPSAKDALSDSDTTAIKAWIEAGAPQPKATAPVAP